MARNTSDKEHEPDIQGASDPRVQAAVDSMSGLRAFHVSSTALEAANREANSGLMAKAKILASDMTRKKKVRLEAAYWMVATTYCMPPP